MDKGSLVPDELVVDLIKEKVTGKGSKKGFLLDGFPRTLAQAKVLKTMLLDIKNEITNTLIGTTEVSVFERSGNQLEVMDDSYEETGTLNEEKLYE